MDVLEELKYGVAAMLADYEEDPFADLNSPCLQAEEAAQVIIYWLLTHKRVREALSELAHIDRQDHTVSPDLYKIAQTELGLALD